MATFHVDETAEGVAIELTEVAGHEEELLEAFAECQSGHCACPTDEYEKVEHMEIGAKADEVFVRLTVKPGVRFDLDEISACLDYTTSKVAESG